MVSQLITSASREGARLAAMEGSTNADVTAHVRQILSDATGVAESDVAVTITVDNAAAGNSVASAERGDPCTVAVEIPYDRFQYFAARFLQDATLRCTITMRRE